MRALYSRHISATSSRTGTSLSLPLESTMRMTPAPKSKFRTGSVRASYGLRPAQYMRRNITGAMTCLQPARGWGGSSSASRKNAPSSRPVKMRGTGARLRVGATFLGRTHALLPSMIR